MAGSRGGDGFTRVRPLPLPPQAASSTTHQATAIEILSSATSILVLATISWSEGSTMAPAHRWVASSPFALCASLYCILKVCTFGKFNLCPFFLCTCIFPSLSFPFPTSNTLFLNFSPPNCATLVPLLFPSPGC